MARIEEKKTQLARLRQNWSETSLEGEYIGRYKKEVDALLCLSWHLDPSIAKRVADMLAKALKGN